MYMYNKSITIVIEKYLQSDYIQLYKYSILTYIWNGMEINTLQDIKSMSRPGMDKPAERPARL